MKKDNQDEKNFAFGEKKYLLTKEQIEADPEEYSIRMQINIL